MLAIFDNLGFSELLVVLVVAILFFGKRLPEVASQAGMQIAKFRRSLQDIKNETGIDEDLRKIQRDIQNAVPRNLSMGEMARIASVELEKRIKANDERKESEPGKAEADRSKAAPVGAAAETVAREKFSPADSAAAKIAEADAAPGGKASPGTESPSAPAPNAPQSGASELSESQAANGENTHRA
jgi:TatA/E family protein of Tat protein translocase